MRLLFRRLNRLFKWIVSDRARDDRGVFSHSRSILDSLL